MAGETQPGVEDDSLEHWVARARTHAKLADAVLGEVDGARWRRTQAARELGTLPGESFELDLEDPEQRRFGDYELVEKIGQGGMGVVYRALQRSLDREVAIKILAAGPWANAAHGERFQREARHAARLVHPNIVAVHEIARIDDIDYFSMRLVRGDALSDRIARDGAFEPLRAAWLLRTLAEALSYAHSLGVLHLDLKPGNVLLEADGTPLVADFGLARRADDAPEGESGEVSGTPSYMAPEQAEPGRHAVGAATDVWGLGTILYECLTGQPPFRARSAHATMRAVLADAPVPPRALAPAIPRDLEAICLACLAKDAARRYASARALADDLGRFIDGLPVSVRPGHAVGNAWRWAKREPRTALASALAFAALAGGLVATTQQWRRAQHAAEQASRYAGEARASESRAQHTLWAHRVDVAWQRYSARDPLAALPELVANLGEQEAAGAHAEARLERARIGALLRQAPVLVGVIGLADAATAVDLDVARGRIHVGTTRGDVVQLGLDDGSERWRTSTLGRGRGAPERWFSAVRALSPVPGRDALLARADSPDILPKPYAQTYLLDGASGAATLPLESIVPNLLYQAIEPNARYAVVVERGERFAAQRYRVDGWRPDGARLDFQREMRTFLISPDGASIATSAGGSHSVELYDGATMQRRTTLLLDETASAWAYSPDARTLALGQSNGRLELVDVASGARRSLEPAPDGVVTGIAFDPGGGKLIASSADGSVRAWSLDTGLLAAQPLRLAGSVYGFAYDGGSRTIAAVRDEAGIVSVHALPEQPAALGEAADLVPGLRHVRRLSHGAIDLDAATHLLAVALEREIRLWRLPRPALAALRAPTELAGELHYDGEHLPVVADAVVAIADRGGRIVSPSIGFDAPVAFAQVDGGRLVVVAGRTVHVRAWRSGRALAPPFELAATPVRFAIDESARTLVVTHGAYRGGRYREIAAVLDLDDGTAAASFELDGAQSGLRIDARGATAFAWRGGSIEVVPLSGPSRRRRLEHPEAEGVVRDLAVSRDGGALWSVTSNPRMLRRWSLADGSIAHEQALPCGRDSNDRLDRHDAVGGMVMPDDDGRRVVFNCTDAGAVMVWDDTVRVLPHAASLRPTRRGHLGGYHRAAALARDGRRYARALRDGAIVADLETGTMLAPVLSQPLDANDMVEALAFSPDGTRLVAWTKLGRWLAWDLPTDERPLAEIEQDLAELVPGTAAGRVPRARAALQARDPGPWRRDQAPALPSARSIEGGRVPPRDAALPDTLVDLTPHYNTPLVMLGTGERSTEGTFLIGRHGPMRLLGVDYDVRGLVETFSGPWGGGALPPVVVPIAPQRFVAVHALLQCGAPIVGETGPALYLALQYADGGEIDLPITFGREPDCSDLELESPGRPRLAFGNAADQTGQLFSVRLANPHPQRVVRALSMRSGPIRAARHAFHALTLEPGVP